MKGCGQILRYKWLSLRIPDNHSYSTLHSVFTMIKMGTSKDIATRTDHMLKVKENGGRVGVGLEVGEISKKS